MKGIETKKNGVTRGSLIQNKIKRSTPSKLKLANHNGNKELEKNNLMVSRSHFQVVSVELSRPVMNRNTPMPPIHPTITCLGKK
mmetsp:Transcript_18533/g.17854  ORF Transcript_18533/g.17854 Transcript_18533/m.17854 type:complete len:84 (-) Transcript_18533:535-786(-)